MLILGIVFARKGLKVIMLTRKLGNTGLEVSALGLGCMGMSAFYGATAEDKPEAVATIEEALNLGINFIDTADVYEDNEELVGKAIKARRSQIILATKFGHVHRRNPDGSPVYLDGSPEYVKQACEASLRRLGVEVIDLYYLHRPDPNTPIEVTVGAMAELVKEGKVRYLGLSECLASTLRRANAVHPITAVQTEYSIWSRDVEAEVLPTCEELGVGFVAYSPLGRGFLAGRFKDVAELDQEDWRRDVPRFQAGNIEHNVELLHLFEAFARDKGCTSGQLALAWLLAQSKNIVPIPGTRRRTYLQENIGAVNIVLDTEELTYLNGLFGERVAGERYPDYAMQWVEQLPS